MSRLNINRNIFLEKEELSKFQEFLTQSTVQQALLENSSKWGIVRSIFTGVSPDYLIEVGSNIGTIKLATDSKAVDKDKLLIKQLAFDNLSVPNDGNFYWVKISHEYSPLEVGECSINVNGQVSGVNTLFTEVLRGQSTEVPVKIKFYKTNGLVNDQSYEVVSVDDDLNIILAGSNFSAESALRYIVIGSTPIGETITSQQLQGLYQYDACKIEFISESTLDTPPTADYVEDKQFYIARVVNNSGTVTVEDKREDQFLTFNVEGMSGKLTTLNYLSEFDTEEKKSQARANLGVQSAIDATQYDSSWQIMTKGVAANSVGFDVKIRRVGKLCIVQGTFTSGNMVPNAIIAQIPYSSIYAVGESVLGVSEQIRFFAGPQVGNNTDNYGLFGYIPKIVDSNEFYLYLKVEAGTYSYSFGSKFNINFSFFIN